MAPLLSNDLAHALDVKGAAPLRTVHPVTGKAFFLVSEDFYERLRPLFENVPTSLDEQGFHLRETGRRAGWDEPAMDAYDNYDEQRSQSKP